MTAPTVGDMVATTCPRVHGLRRVAAVLLALVVALLTVTAAPASAHDVLAGSDPADGATVATLPVRVALTFSEEPNPQFATVTVVGPDGARYEQGAATVDANTVSVAARPGPAGRYEVGYRVVSSDGHPVAGSLAFTATAGAAAPAPSTEPATVPSPAASTSPDDGGPGGLPTVLTMLGAVVVVAAALALVLRRRA